MRTLIAGWFSFAEGHATAGDFAALDLTRAWLAEAGQHYDVAFTAAFPGGVDWRRVEPSDYSQVVFVCGPFGKGTELELAFLERFAGARLLGLNLSMIEPLDEWNPFDVLLERDSSIACHPDIVFLAPPASQPVVGVCRVEAYEGGQTELANRVIDELIAEAQVAKVEIDTRLDINAGGLRNASEIASVIARMDALITTRLHGLVLALKHGVPVLAIDPEPARGKIIRQAQAVGWPLTFPVDRLALDELRRALEYCLSPAARTAARACAARGVDGAEKTHRAFVDAAGRGTPQGSWRLGGRPRRPGGKTDNPRHWLLRARLPWR
jgi:polysaccharide pyruvyl transferase